MVKMQQGAMDRCCNNMDKNCEPSQSPYRYTLLRLLYRTPVAVSRAELEACVVFSSHLFLFYFLPLALVAYYVSPRIGKHLVLTLLSYLFYAWANPLFVVLMLLSTAIDYVCGRVICPDTSTALPIGGSRSRRQRLALVLSITSNMTLLCVFKYFNFAVDNYDALVAVIGLPDLALDTVMRITLPLGISFYTFQSMSYSIDIYRGEARPIRNPIDFACYVSMFPQLVAGPIIRFQEVADQLRQRSHTLEKAARGIAFIACGLGKKIILANPCGKVADLAFSADSLAALDAWMGIVGYAFQIYFDFSAYSDMAIGLGLLLGFVFPKNFDSPYRATSITDFWRRWHISLSTWLRDYLYIPLGGNRKGNTRTYVNLGLVMVLGGLWHGASWNFAIWGAIHGAMLAVERLQGKDSLYRRLPTAARVVITFVTVCIAWVFFRAATLDAALDYLQAMLGLGAPSAGAALLSGILYTPYHLLWLAVAGFTIWGLPQTWDFTRRLTPLKVAWIGGVFVAAILLMTTQSYNPFIYFIF